MKTLALFYRNDGWEDITIRRMSDENFEKYLCTLRVPATSNVMVVQDFEWTEVKYLKITGNMLNVGLVKGDTIQTGDGWYDMHTLYDPAMHKDWIINPETDVYTHKWWASWAWYKPKWETAQCLTCNYYFNRKITEAVTILRIQGNIKLTEHQNEWKP
ncbi:MAG: hypothetical protein WCP55_08085 [Lentisphaerota bacterium]